MLKARRARGLLGAFIAGLSLVAPGAAAASTSGDVTFECTATFPEWPSSQGQGRCGHGTLPSTAIAMVTGLDNDGEPYVLFGVGSIQFDFVYSTACVLNEPPLLGTIQGVVSVTGLVAFHAGQITTAHLTANVSGRVGTGAFAFTSSNHTVFFGNGGTATGILGGGGGPAIPLHSLANNRCPSGDSMQSQWVGAWDVRA